MAPLLTSVAACERGPAVDGVFNNERDYEIAYSEHLAAWARQVGTSAKTGVVEGVFQRRGGECTWSKGARQLICAVDVDPRGLALTQRIMWSMSFVPEGAGRVRLLNTRLHHLGYDL